MKFELYLQSKNYAHETLKQFTEVVNNLFSVCSSYNQFQDQSI